MLASCTRCSLRRTTPVVYLAVGLGELLFVSGIYFTFVMLISAISVSMTMLVLCVHHQAPSHSAATCTPVPRWVSTASCHSVDSRRHRYLLYLSPSQILSYTCTAYTSDTQARPISGSYLRGTHVRHARN